MIQKTRLIDIVLRPSWVTLCLLPQFFFCEGFRELLVFVDGFIVFIDKLAKGVEQLSLSILFKQ